MRLDRLSRPEVLLPLTAVALTGVAFLLIPTYTDAMLRSYDGYSTLQTFARLGPLALALGLTMIAGEFDLSVVGIYALGGMLTVQLGEQHVLYGVLGAVAAGAAIGLAQGSLIAGLRLPSMPVTLATYIALLGLASRSPAASPRPTPTPTPPSGSTSRSGRSSRREA